MEGYLRLQCNCVVLYVVECICTGRDIHWIQGDRIHRAWRGSARRDQLWVCVYAEDANSNVLPKCWDGRGTDQLAGVITGRNCLAAVTHCGTTYVEKLACCVRLRVLYPASIGLDEVLHWDGKSICQLSEFATSNLMYGVRFSDEVLVWLSVWSEVQIVCIWSSWCHCHPKTLSSLAWCKSGLILPFCYRLTQVVLEKRPLNGCSSSSSTLSEFDISLQFYVHFSGSVYTRCTYSP